VLLKKVAEFVIKQMLYIVPTSANNRDT